MGTRTYTVYSNLWLTVVSSSITLDSVIEAGSSTEPRVGQFHYSSEDACAEDPLSLLSWVLGLLACICVRSWGSMLAWHILCLLSHLPSHVLVFFKKWSPVVLASLEFAKCPRITMSA